MIMQFKKALNLGAFFLLYVFSTLQPGYATTCSADRISPKEENATVKWVYDGDTLLLTDKRKIRIIGIDTPEVKHHQQAAQAYGAKAKEALRALLKKHHYHILLRHGKEKTDRYGRELAHVFLPDHTNISTWLLERGYAKTMAIPPNVALADCYKQAEKDAQRQALRIWRQDSLAIKKADNLSYSKKGFVRLMGKVIKIIHHKKSYILELDSDTKSHIQLKIRKKHWRYFDMDKLDKLTDRKIKVSGVLKNRRGKRILYLSHSSQLEIIPINRIKPTIKWSL